MKHETELNENLRLNYTKTSERTDSTGNCSVPQQQLCAAVTTAGATAHITDLESCYCVLLTSCIHYEVNAQRGSARSASCLWFERQLHYAPYAASCTAHTH